MRKIHEVLRLAFEAGLATRAIARCVNASPTTVGDYLRRAKAAGLSWPLPAAMDDSALEARLFPPAQPQGRERPLPDWAEVHRELKRKGVTLALLWQEYKAAYAEGLQYSWFCEQYRLWRGQLDVVMRQDHRAGEKLFVDYAGQTVPVVDRNTGELRQAQIFIAVLGASNYTYAEATWTQTLPDWIGAHVRTFAFLGGVSELVIPDNLRSGVAKAHRYEPEANPTYHDMASHYGIAVFPARVRKPRDKAKVEVGVQIVERWVLAGLRSRTFFSLHELNAAIDPLLARLNDRPFKKLPGSRRQLFETLDRPALKPLPATPYVYAEWGKVRVHIDYHVELEGHYYSVPHQLVKRQLEVRFTPQTVECFYQGRRVASHRRAYHKGRHTTLPEHMPTAHRQYQAWSPERFIRWANKIGPGTAKLIEGLLTARRHPQQSYRTCLGILRLGRAYGEPRLEAACRRALTLGAQSVKSVESILKHGLDHQGVPEQEELAPPIDHDNIRGSSYYH